MFPLCCLRNEAFVENYRSNLCLSVASSLCFGVLVWFGFLIRCLCEFNSIFFHRATRQCPVSFSYQSFPWVRVFRLFHDTPPLPAEFRCWVKSVTLGFGFSVTLFISGGFLKDSNLKRNKARRTGNLKCNKKLPPNESILEGCPGMV